jgi:hypothetical protein
MNSNNIHSSLKRIGVSLLLAGTISSFALATAIPPPRTDVSELAKKALSNSFPKAESVKWMESKNGEVCTAYFWLYDVKTVASYDQEGTLLSIIRYYNEDHLPVAVLSRVKNKYHDRTIAGVTEMTDSNEEVSYYIKMEDKTHWYTVKVADGGMEQTEKLDKQ